MHKKLLRMAVSRVVARLNEVMQPIQGWVPIPEKFRIETRERFDRTLLTCDVRVIPRGWPFTDFLYLKLWRFSGSVHWQVVEGCIRAERLGSEFERLLFDANDIVIAGRSTVQLHDKTPSQQSVLRSALLLTG